MSEKAKNIVSCCVKVLGVVLAVWLLRHTIECTDGDFIASLKTASVPFLISAIVCYGVVNLITAWRWGQLLDVQGIHLTFWELFRLNMIGVFFSNVIPGSVSGDVVKFAYVVGKAPHRKTECALSMLVDRLIGLSAMLLVAAISAVFAGIAYPDIVWGNHLVCTSVIVVFCLIAIDILLIVGIVLRKQIFRIAVLRRGVRLIGRHSPKSLKAFIMKLVHAVDLYKDNPKSCLYVLLASMGVHLLLAVQNCLIGKAFHEHVMTPLQYVITTQLGNITGVLPLTPGGIGLRDTMTAKLFAFFGAEPADVLGLIPVCYSIDMVLWGLFGAALLVFTRDRRKVE